MGNLWTNGKKVTAKVAGANTPPAPPSDPQEAADTSYPKKSISPARNSYHANSPVLSLTEKEEMSPYEMFDWNTGGFNKML